MTAPIISRAGRPWRLLHAENKLAARGQLPGAFGYDRSAAVLRKLRAQGTSEGELLPLALPGSWMVNARAASPVFKKWLQAPLIDRWVELLHLLEGGCERWRRRDESDRARVLACVKELCIDGQGCASVSKVLCLLRPETCCLMDDAAIWLALEALPQPTTADAPSAGADHFLPMLDWFASETLASERDLIALARAHALVDLDAAQVLDRLLWFESWGHRLFATKKTKALWWWVADGEREGVVPVDAEGAPMERIGQRVELGEGLPAAWVSTARAAL